MSNKQKIITVALVLVAIIGIVLGLVLVKQRQDLSKSASVLTGNTTVSLTPESGTYEVGDTIPVSVFFNTDGTAISGVAIRLVYNYTGSVPEITAGDIQINSELTNTGDWQCPTQEVIAESDVVNINIGCANTNSGGFVSTTDTLLATLNLIVNQIPSNNPTIVTFDPAESRITDLTGADILLTPTSTGTYTVGTPATPTIATEITNTLTPSPTSAPTATNSPNNSPTPTSVNSPTPTTATTGTVTPTRRVTGSPTPTGQTLTEAGVSTPTMIGISVGILAIIASILLVF